MRPARAAIGRIPRKLGSFDAGRLEFGGPSFGRKRADRAADFQPLSGLECADAERSSPAAFAICSFARFACLDAAAQAKVILVYVRRFRESRKEHQAQPARPIGMAHP